MSQLFSQVQVQPTYISLSLAQSLSREIPPYLFLSYTDTLTVNKTRAVPTYFFVPHVNRNQTRTRLRVHV